MAMTDEEAKTKWCPFARVATDQGSANCGRYDPGFVTDSNRNPLAARCLGSECGLWSQTGQKIYSSKFEDIVEATGQCGLIRR